MHAPRLDFRVDAERQSISRNYEPINPLKTFLTIGECHFLHLDLIKKVHKNCKKLFKTVNYAYCSVPTYPSGCIGFFIMSDSELNFKIPLRSFGEDFEKIKLRYYNSQVHTASFCLPQFVVNALND
jgi:spermidine synthase